MRRKIGPLVANQPDRPDVAGNMLLNGRSWSAVVPQTIRAEDVRVALREYFLRYATSDCDIAPAELIVAELVANVVRHALGSASFHLDWHGRRPRLTVSDGGPGFPESHRPTMPDPNAQSGRGLAIVQALGIEMELGNRPEGGGYVHVTLPLERQPERA